jgi:hypothetical protein
MIKKQPLTGKLRFYLGINLWDTAKQLRSPPIQWLMLRRHLLDGYLREKECDYIATL